MGSANRAPCLASALDSLSGPKTFSNQTGRLVGEQQYKVSSTYSPSNCKTTHGGMHR